jgi:hypothetical protein
LECGFWHSVLLAKAGFLSRQESRYIRETVTGPGIPGRSGDHIVWPTHLDLPTASSGASAECIGHNWKANEIWLIMLSLKHRATPAIRDSQAKQMVARWEVHLRMRPESSEGLIKSDRLTQSSVTMPQHFAWLSFLLR